MSNENKTREDELLKELTIAFVILMGIAIMISVSLRPVTNTFDDVKPSSEDYYVYRYEVIKELGTIVDKHYQDNLLFDDYILVYEKNDKKSTQQVFRETYLKYDIGDILKEKVYEYYDSHIVDLYEEDSKYIIILNTENYGTLALSVPKKEFEYAQENNEYSINKVNTEPEVKVIDLPEKYKKDSENSVKKTK